MSDSAVARAACERPVPIRSRGRWHGLTLRLADRSTYRPVWQLQRRIWELRCGLAVPDTLLLLEHEPVITLGRHADEANVLPAEDVGDAPPEIVRVDRGGDVTYHGPGQLVAYLIADLRAHELTVRGHVEALEAAVIRALAVCGVQGEQRRGLTGVWARERSRWAKVAALGVRIARGVSFHGVALNVSGALDGFERIVPCGLSRERVTSIEQLTGRPGSIEQVADALEREIGRRFAIRFHRLDADAVADETHIEPLVERLRNAATRAPRRPSWLRVGLPVGAEFARVRRALSTGSLHTVCESARCPNQQECWNAGTATFLILGDRCTRACRFCAVGRGGALDPDGDEPDRTARAAAELGLEHLVVTSVTRDDLPDGGARAFAATVAAVRRHLPRATIELLVPDFCGDAAAIEIVLAARPDVLGHNVETVPRLYPAVRPGAGFTRSLELLQRAAASGLRAKSGFMVGLGESPREVSELLRTLRAAGCSRVTIGQYLQPTRDQLPVQRYATEEEFSCWRAEALELGLADVVAGPLVRSSYRAAAGLAETPGVACSD